MKNAIGKVISYKFFGELSLEQCATFIFGLTQSCIFQKITKLYSYTIN